MTSHFTSEFFRNNRQKLRELVGNPPLLVIAGNGLLQRGADSTYAFAQDASFWYLTGIDEPDIILVLNNDKEFLMVPSRDASREAFDGAVTEAPLKERSGVDSVLSLDEGWERIATSLADQAEVATLAAPPAYIEQYGMYTNPSRAQLLHKIQQLAPDIAVTDISQHLSAMRMIKQPQELAAIQQAIDITADSLQIIIGQLKSHGYLHEYEVEADLTASFRKKGATGHAFEPIVASGKRACTLHNVANNGPLNQEELIVLDVGAEVEHYAADITRTVSLKAPTTRQQAVYDAVLDVQEYAKGLLKPGILLKEYEQTVEDYMGSKLIELGLIQKAEHNAIRQYYPHATSHFMGLNVHDTGVYAEPLRPGTVLTIEPGIYIPKESIGIRIEDDILITETGIQVLTEKLSRKLYT